MELLLDGSLKMPSEPRYVWTFILLPKLFPDNSSRYERTVTDLPWQGVTVQIQLLTRRFFCTNKTCVRRIFCERLPRVVATYGRQTVRLNDTLRLIGMMLGVANCKHREIKLQTRRFSNHNICK